MAKDVMGLFKHKIGVPTINLARCRVSISFSDYSVTEAKGAFGSFTPLLM